MDKAVLYEVMACLPKDRTLFRYGRGDYALMLLSRAAGKGVRIGHIRQSSYGQLLGKPSVKKLMSGNGGGVLTGSMFNHAYSNQQENFLLTVGRWNDTNSAHNQTSRNSGNLVLQLNFNASHDREFMRVIGKSCRDDFFFLGHPVLQKGERKYFRNTLAWVRMDVDFNTGEALIEEVQTDWLREAREFLWDLERYAQQNKPWLDAMVVNGKVGAAKYYVEKTLAPYFKMWDEAALTAAINFIVDELGIKRVYYHSFETGNVLKSIHYGLPPRSLYTDLPRKFCFTATGEMPKMLTTSKVVEKKLKKLAAPCWYRLELCN